MINTPFSEERIRQIADRVLSAPITPTGTTTEEIIIDEEELAILRLQIELAISQVIETMLILFDPERKRRMEQHQAKFGV